MRKLIAYTFAAIFGLAIGIISAIIGTFGTLLLMIFGLSITGVISYTLYYLGFEQSTYLLVIPIGSMGTLFFFVIFDKQLLFSRLESLEEKLQSKSDKLLDRIEGK